MMDAFKSIVTVEYIKGVKSWAGNLLTENYGNAIITNTSFATNNPIKTLPNIFSTTPKNGRRINFSDSSQRNDPLLVERKSSTE